ncbi:lipoxygenase 1, chloroplastic [Tanacetum coccineum]
MKIVCLLGKLCEKQAQVVANDPLLMLVKGEIISDWYWNNVCEEINDRLQECSQIAFAEIAINDRLQECSQIAFAEIAAQLQVGSELLVNVLEPRIGSLLKGRLEGGQLYTPAYVARVRGAARGITVPMNVSAWWSPLQLMLQEIDGASGVAVRLYELYPWVNGIEVLLISRTTLVFDPRGVKKDVPRLCIEKYLKMFCKDAKEIGVSIVSLNFEHGKWKFDVWRWKKWEETCYGVCLLSPASSKYLPPETLKELKDVLILVQRFQLSSVVYQEGRTAKAPKKSKEAVLKDWSQKANLKSEKVNYTSDILVESDFGVPGAITITNKHQKEFYLESITIEGFACGPVYFPCNSWVQSVNDHAEPRIFFSNQPYLPDQTPAGIKLLREKELRDLRGDGTGVRKLSGRIYDYDIYNHLGNPDRGTESRVEKPFPLYVPRDEQFDESKQNTFSTSWLKAVLHNLLASMVARISKKHDFKGFSQIESLYSEGVLLKLGLQDDLIKKLRLTNLVTRLHESSQDGGLLKYDTPKILSKDRFSWLRDDEFACQALVGVNPVSIEKLKVFHQFSWLHDDEFAHQAHAGVNPVSIEKLKVFLPQWTVQQLTSYFSIRFKALWSQNQTVRVSSKEESMQQVFFITTGMHKNASARSVLKQENSKKSERMQQESKRTKQESKQASSSKLSQNLSKGYKQEG